MDNNIEINYRPDSYFGPRRLDEYLVSQVKGTVVREMLETLLVEGQHQELQTLIGKVGVSKSSLKALESAHPMFLGGNFLPDTEKGEIEIARIEIDSIIFDVTSLYARQDNGLLYYRVVDEYDGDTLSGPADMTSEKPLTLSEMADFFLGAWPLIEVLERVFSSDLESALGFFIAKSEFYPGFGKLCQERVIEAFAETENQNEEDE